MKFTSFSELKKARPGSFRIEKRNRRGDFLIFAPHAGGIEPGTSEICKWFNKKPFSYYVFEGSGTNCRELHITSALFDEPKLIKLLGKKNYAVSIHGMTNTVAVINDADVFLGGLNSELIKLTQINLKNSGFTVNTNIELPNSLISGKEPQNVTNRCVSKLGMQIEISEKLRRLFFKGELKRRAGRTETTALFEIFCNAVQESILGYKQQVKV